jgi:tetratricopeptide (TPR) repeat protein
MRSFGGFGLLAVDRFRHTRRWALALPVAVVLLHTGGAVADDEDPRRAQAERLRVEGRCAAALDVARDLRADGVVDSELLVLEGLCALQQRRYQDAVSVLREALRQEPAHAEARLRLAIALYHLGEHDAARRELETAEHQLSEPNAEALLYRGLLTLEARRPAEAAEVLERAHMRDARAVEPVASYYAALAWARSRERARAEAAIARVLSEWPDTPWASEAERIREQLATSRLRRWALVRAGFEYDDNVVLQGSGAPLPEEISSARDVLGTWSAETGAELLRSERWSAGVLGSYSGNAHADISSFDTHYPVLAGWLDRQIDDATTLRLAVDGGHAWVDGGSFFATGRTSVTLLRAWESAGASEFYLRFRLDEYFENGADLPDGTGTPGAPCPAPPPGASISTCGPPGVDERRERNRDGRSAVAGMRHALELPALRSTLRAGYDFERFDASGSEYSHVAHSLSAGILIALPLRFVLDVAGIVTWRPFDEPSTFPDPPEPFFDKEFGVDDDDRDERYSAVSISLARPLGRGLTASAGWRRERNRSNVDVFDYRREVLGTYLSWSWGH